MNMCTYCEKIEKSEGKIKLLSIELLSREK